MIKEIKYRWWLLFAITITGFGLDLWSKMAAVKSLTVGVPVNLMGNKLELYLIYNKAALFGLDPRHLISWFPVNGFFTVFTCIAIFALVIYYLFLKKHEVLLHCGLAIVLPGAIGNLFDRLFYPSRGVVDFIKVDLGFWPLNPWPIFNFADIYVTIGVIILIISFFLEEKNRKGTAKISIGS